MYGEAISLLKYIIILACARVAVRVVVAKLSFSYPWNCMGMEHYLYTVVQNHETYQKGSGRLKLYQCYFLQSPQIYTDSRCYLVQGLQWRTTLSHWRSREVVYYMVGIVSHWCSSMVENPSHWSHNSKIPFHPPNEMHQQVLEGKQFHLQLHWTRLE